MATNSTLWFPNSIIKSKRVKRGFRLINSLSKSQVLQFSTGHEGGAGLAARRLNSTLRTAGIESSFCAIGRVGFNPQEFEYGLDRTVMNKMVGKINAVFQSNLSQKSFFSLVSAGFIDGKWLKKLDISTDTILHFHNWFNLVSIRQLGKIQKKGFKIFLTMHDERIFTGGCHYSLSCEKFTSTCEKCPSIPKILENFPQKNLLTTACHLRSKTNPITLIAPSQWIFDEFSKSSVAKIFNVEVIPNVQGNLKFRNKRKPNLSVVRLGYASKYSKSWIKGFDLLQSLIEESKRFGIKFEFIYMNDFEDSEFISSRFWSEIDFLLVPSRMDNSPNVIHEAKINGVPVVASDVGGIGELLSSETDILFDVKTFNPRNLLNKIVNYSSGIQNRTNNTKFQTQYEASQIKALNKLINLYGFKV